MDNICRTIIMDIIFRIITMDIIFRIITMDNIFRCRSGTSPRTSQRQSIAQAVTSGWSNA